MSSLRKADLKIDRKLIQTLAPLPGLRLLYPPPTGPGNQCQDRQGATMWTAWSLGSALAMGEYLRCTDAVAEGRLNWKPTEVKIESARIQCRPCGARHVFK